MRRLSQEDLATLLLPDPALMHSPEGDVKGLSELQEAAQRQIEEHDRRYGRGHAA